MAELSRIMGNGVPYVANVPVFASATGLLMKGGIVSLITANTATGTYYGLTSAADTAQCKKALGPILISDSDALADKENNSLNSNAHRVASNGIPNRAAATGYNWFPAIMNMDQVNFVLWDATSANVIQTNITASTGTAINITGSEASIAGAWLFSTDTTATLTNTFSGSLRYVSLIGGTGTVGLTTAMNVSVDSDLILVRPVNHRLTQGDTTGRFLMSTSAAGAGVSLHILENYIDSSQSAMTALRFYVHDGIDGLAVKTVKLYSEVIYLNHVYRSTLA